MDPRPIAEWIKIFGKLDATNITAEYAVANRIIGDLVGYQHTAKARHRDTKELVNALQAYAKMLQDAGVKVVD